MADLPVIFIHRGNQDYLKLTIRQAKKVSSRVILIGDRSNKTFCEEHYLIDDLNTAEIARFERLFVNYSTNIEMLEKICFLRMFYMREVMKKNNISTAIHLDSDCMLFNNIFTGKLAYIYNRFEKHDIKMSASVACSCLTMEFLNKFVELCNDIYVTKTKLFLLNDKIEYHKKNNIPGGVCDMTLYYILSTQLDVINLLDIQPDGSTYDDNINDSLGFDGYNTFRMVNGMKCLTKISNDFYCFVNSGVIKMNNLHFQGNRGKAYIDLIANEKFVLNKTDLSSSQ